MWLKVSYNAQDKVLSKRNIDIIKSALQAPSEYQNM